MTISTLNDQLIENICDHIRNGAPFYQAALLAGVNRYTHDSWRKRGYLDEAENKETLHSKLVSCEARARAEYFQSLVGVLTNKAKEDWVAAITVLERRDPSNWGKNNYKSDVIIDPDSSYSDQHKEIARQMNKGNLSANEALQRAQIVREAAKTEEISNFRKELDALKELATKDK